MSMTREEAIEIFEQKGWWIAQKETLTSKQAEEIIKLNNAVDFALSTLQGENEKLKRALAEMWFAYVNKDREIPHTYEEEAVDLAQEILGPWGECMPKYLRRGPHKED